MKFKTTAIAALALSGLFASGASAETLQTQNGPVAAHTVQTPTGPMVVPNDRTERGVTPSGEPYEVVGELCGYASAEQASHYTQEEIAADPVNWCMRKPGTITGPSAGASRAKHHAKKRDKARSSRKDH